jgi:hypothetical protein
VYRKERIMPAANYLPDVLETTEAERLATGFIFRCGTLTGIGILSIFDRTSCFA